MKQKIGTLIEEKIMLFAKWKAAEEGRSLSDLIQDALELKPTRNFEKNGVSQSQKKGQAT